MQSALSVYPSVCFHSVFRTDWSLTLIFCMCVAHDHSSPWAEGQDHRSRSKFITRPVGPPVRSVLVVLTFDECVGVSLREVVEQRRVDVSAAAATCLCVGRMLLMLMVMTTP